jgi:hypothetical protein
MSNLILNAVIAQAQAKESKAIANLQNYLSNPVGVGEHPDVVEECNKLIHDIAEAKETVKTVNSLIESATKQGE